MSDVLTFWLVVEVAGLLATPVAAVLFARLPTRGLSLGKPLGLLIVTVPVWLLPSWHLLPYDRLTVAAGILALLVASGLALWVLLRQRKLTTGDAAAEGSSPWRRDIRLWIIGEVLFTVAFAAWVVLRAYAPDVWGTEKPMDMAFITAINRSMYFPPNDPWLSGFTINYYYFGHLTVAILLRLTAIEPSTGFNLAVALFYALDVTAVFALTAALYQGLRDAGLAPKVPAGVVGLLGSALTMAVGNLAGVMQQVAHPSPLLQFDWWTPSRVIDNTITEFPFFSFLLADLHAHMLATPYDLLALAGSVQLALAGPRLLAMFPKLSVAGVLELVVLAAIVGAIYPTNGWDFPTQLAIGAGALYLYASYRQQAWWPSVAWWLAWCALAVLIYLPFYLHFSAPTGGVGLVQAATPLPAFLWNYFRIYGVALVALTPLFWLRITSLAIERKVAIWLTVAAIFAIMVLEPAHLAGLFLLLAVLGITAWGFFDGTLKPADRVFWLLAAASVALITVGELVYVRDAFDNGPDYRMNTVFKFGYQAWFLVMILAALALPSGLAALKRTARLLYAGLLILVVAGAAFYPVAGAMSREAGFTAERSLDGLSWLARTSPGDVAAIHWLQQQVSGSPVILEAVGQEYDPAGHARVSTFTGLPTVLGWPGHEAQWNHPTGTRAQDVATIYGTDDIELAQHLLQQYHVTYVFVGSLERADFPGAGLAKFAYLGRAVFNDDGTEVYVLNTP